MSLSISASVTAVGPGVETYFAAQGGTAPYTYNVVAGGAGGSINSGSGLYTAPPTVNSDPSKSFDVIQVTDSLAATATARILVADPLGLLCDILQTELSLSPGRVYFWDQKIMQPTDSGIYIAVGVLSAKPFGNTLEYDGSGGGLNGVQSINMQATVSIDVISRSIEAFYRKEEVLMALASNYSESQQEINSFFIGTLPVAGQFVNLSQQDGAAIPYRYNISVNMQYFVRKTKAVPYYDQFSAADVTTEP